MKAALENREVYLHWIKNDVEPQKIMQIGQKTLMLSVRASQELKDKMKSHL
jgi:hypothetical protein